MASTRAERRRFRKHVFFHQHQLKKYFALSVMSTLNLASRLLPDARHALSFLGIEKPTYAMLKTVAAVALSNNRKKFEISREERGNRIGSGAVVAFRELSSHATVACEYNHFLISLAMLLWNLIFLLNYNQHCYRWIL